MTTILFKNEAYSICGAIFAVYREMGSGFLEAVYQECLALEFTACAIPFTAKPHLSLTYRGFALDQTYRPDFLCHGKIVVELKAVKETVAVHRAQVFNYLKATGCQLGLLVNFGHYPKATVERLVLGTAKHAKHAKEKSLPEALSGPRDQP